MVRFLWVQLIVILLLTLLCENHTHKVQTYKKSLAVQHLKKKTLFNSDMVKTRGNEESRTIGPFPFPVLIEQNKGDYDSSMAVVLRFSFLSSSSRRKVGEGRKEGRKGRGKSHQLPGLIGTQSDGEAAVVFAPPSCVPLGDHFSEPAGVHDLGQQIMILESGCLTISYDVVISTRSWSTCFCTQHIQAQHAFTFPVSIVKLPLRHISILK